MSRQKQSLEAWLEELREHRLSGVKAVQFDDRRIEYRSDAEMARAYAFGRRLLDTERGAAAPPSVIRFHTSKGN